MTASNSATSGLRTSRSQCATVWLPELRAPFHRWQLTIIDVMRTTLDGRFGEAEALIEQMAAGAREWWARGVEQMVPVLLSSVRRLQGRLEKIAPALKAAAATHPGV